MSRRFIAPWKDSATKPAVYHCLNRVVDRRFVFEAAENGTLLPDLGMAKMLRCRGKYFTDGAVIGSREFVNEVFAGARERFTAKRKDGARTMKGSGSGAKGVWWSMRDLRVRI